MSSIHQRTVPTKLAITLIAAVVAFATLAIATPAPASPNTETISLIVRVAEVNRSPTDPLCIGAGVPNLEHIRHEIDGGDIPTATQTFAYSTGVGSLEASRGTDHLEHEGVTLEGEQDIFGQAWDGVCWSGLSWSGLSWSGLSWSGVSWD